MYIQSKQRKDGFKKFCSSLVEIMKPAAWQFPLVGFQGQRTVQRFLRWANWLTSCATLACPRWGEIQLSVEGKFDQLSRLRQASDHIFDWSLEWCPEGWLFLLQRKLLSFLYPLSIIEEYGTEGQIMAPTIISVVFLVEEKPIVFLDLWCLGAKPKSTGHVLDLRQWRAHRMKATQVHRKWPTNWWLWKIVDPIGWKKEISVCSLAPKSICRILIW